MKDKLPENITLEQLESNWREAESVYAPAFKRARILDATDRGRLWKAINAKFPAYQILPDTNDVAYVKSNLLASLYSIGRSAKLLPTSEHDLETVENLNVVLEHIWDTELVGYYQMQAGERAALLNLGITQVGWDNSIVRGTGETFAKGKTSFKNIDPMRFMRDPYSENLETAAYCMTWDRFHKNVIKRNKNYKEAFEEFLRTQKQANSSEDTYSKMTDKAQQSNKDVYRVVIHWVMDGKDIHEIHTIDSKYVLFVKDKIKPALYPFAELYCNLPSGDVLGTSAPSLIFANSVARNLMNSIILTAEFKNQKPPRFVNTESQINIRDFVKHGADADYVFQVRGDASRAVHYHEFPQVSAMASAIVNSLGMDVQQVSGVDGKYTGKDTGSILTTGGIEQMLDQATLIDQPKIVNYEHYSTQLTKLVLGNLIEFGSTRNYFMKNKKTSNYETVTVNYDELKSDSFYDYAIAISPHLPKNKQRIAQMANVIMEKQMQYSGDGQQQVSLITPEEWLMMQDLPMKEFMMERMKIERHKDYVDKVAKTIFHYAEMVENGVEPEMALLETANAMQTGVPSPMTQTGMQQQQEPPMPPPDLPPMNF